MFEPPRCPYPACSRHRDPAGRFYCRHGRYEPRCRSAPVPRFRCLGCRRTFSRQTFRHDYRDRRPETNARVFELLTSGVGLRQTGRLVGLGVRSVQRKMRKIARTCAGLHGNLSARLPAGRTFLLDEEETYEGASIRPVTLPVLIERDSWFVVTTDVGAIRRLAPSGTARRRRQEREEARRGPRADESRASVERVLRGLRRRLPRRARLVLVSDRKTTYGELLRALFGSRAAHQQVSSRMARGTFNPLFAINVTLAMSRDNNGRLRRRSWLVSKRRRYLHAQMQLFTVYRNYVRQRFNRDRPPATPAQRLALLPRRLRGEEVLAWRQDWGPRSIHPLSYTAATSVRERLPRVAVAAADEAG